VNAKRVFAASPGRQESLRMFWPELYDALAGNVAIDSDMPVKRPNCPICSTLPVPPEGGRREIIARLWRNGTPACHVCIERSADRPGGWPLKHQEGRP
jgi:hypothetical protein